MSKIPTYEVVFKKGDTKGVYAISLVENPAMEGMFVALAKDIQPVHLKTLDPEKRIVLGSVLVPEKEIYRKEGSKEFNIKFSADTIRATMEEFAEQGYHKNSTLEHTEVKLEDVAVVESWIKDDMEKDKSALHGFDDPVGTWYVAMKINNDELWEDYIKTGKVKGFSIDGLFNFEEITLNKLDMSAESEKSLIDKIIAGVKEVFAGKTPAEVALGKVDANEGELSFEFEGDELKVDSQLTMKGLDGEMVSVPDGTYTIGDEATGFKEVSVVGSVVTEIKDKEVVKEDAPADLTEKTEAQTVKSEKFIQELVYAMAQEIPKAIDTKLAALKVDLKKQVLDEMEAEKVALTKEKGEPQKPWEEMTVLERRRANK